MSEMAHHAHEFDSFKGKTLVQMKIHANQLAHEKAALREAARVLLAQIKAIKLYGDLACVQLSGGFGGNFGGKKPPSKEVWQFPRHMLVEIDAAISKMEEVL